MLLGQPGQELAQQTAPQQQQIPDGPKPQTIPRWRAGPVPGKVPNCMSMSVEGVSDSVPLLLAIRSSS